MTVMQFFHRQNLSTEEYLHAVQSLCSVKGQFRFIPFHYNSYESIISILKMVTFVKHKTN